MFQMATFTAADGRLFRLTIVLSLLIGEGSGCKSASLAPSGPLRNSKDHMVSEFCITYYNSVFFRIMSIYLTMMAEANLPFCVGSSQIKKIFLLLGHPILEQQQEDYDVDS